MENIPKIVRAQLARAAFEEHPDADLLTGFAEEALGKAERQRVMAHLSRCGDCREVVALALPASEAAAAPGGPRLESGPWFTWPVLRWAAVAAGALLVTSIGILRYEKSAQEQPDLVSTQLQNENRLKDDRQKEDKVAALQTPQPLVPPSAQAVPQPEKAAKQLPAPKLSHQQNAIAANQSATQLDGLFSVVPPTNRASSANGSGTGGGIGGGVYQPQQEANNNGPAINYQEQAKIKTKTGSLAPEPATEAPLPATSPDAQISSQDQALSGGVVAQNQPDLFPEDQRNLDVVKAKDSVPQQGGVNAVAAPTAPSLATLAGLGTSVRWTISSAGVLQRSVNGGTTWQDLDVNTQVTESQRKSSARTEDYLYKKNYRNQRPGVFRAVAASGSEVWAGGSGGMLVHSLDAGNHWSLVAPSEGKVSLTGDIVGVEFSDIQHGKISTSSGDVWITGDDGQTWHKQ